MLSPRKMIPKTNTSYFKIHIFLCKMMTLEQSVKQNEVLELTINKIFGLSYSYYMQI